MLAPGTRIGPYDVSAQIGAGGMGEVYRATDTNLKRAESVWQLSTVTGFEPQWRADGKELFYLQNITRTRVRLLAVPIGSGANPAGTPRALFEFSTGPTIEQNNVYVYAPSPDGQRFLIDVFAADAQPSLETGAQLGRVAVTTPSPVFSLRSRVRDKNSGPKKALKRQFQSR